VSILVRSWTGWRGKPHLTYLAFLEVDRANTPRLDIAALQAEGIDQRFEILKITVRGRTARVHDAFRNSLVVKVEYFFPPDEIFEQGRAARARAQPILVIGDANALIGREMGIFFRVGPLLRDLLVGLAALTGRRLKVFVFCHAALLLWKSLRVRWDATVHDIKPSSRLEAVAQHADEKEDNCEHPAIMF